jgi:hypothetical protein
MVVLILRLNCWKEPITPRLGSEGSTGLDSRGGSGGGGPAPDFSGGKSVVVVWGIEGGMGGGGLDISWELAFASSAAA